MFDTKTKLILGILAKECDGGGYHIVEVSDIILALPRRFRVDSGAVKSVLSRLEREDIISVKYEDGGTYCLVVLPQGYEILQSKEDVIEKKKREKHSILQLFVIFISSFFGSFLAALVFFFLSKLL